MKFNPASFKSSVLALLLSVGFMGAATLEGPNRYQKHLTLEQTSGAKILVADGQYPPPQYPGQPPKALA